VWAGGLTGPFVLLMIVAFLTAFYMFRVAFPAIRARARSQSRTDHGGSGGSGPGDRHHATACRALAPRN
jgi:NADH:ubiquinone oxidoreductase subunit 5 (subunit L)/multisubunit Na+/H+ antiporter MnhA subunit